jgi:hypothetical protein
MAGTYEPLARRLCRVVNDLAVAEWVTLAQVTKELKGAPDELVQGAIEYAAQKGWIEVEGRPAARLMLTPAGVSVGQKKSGYPYGPGKGKPPHPATKRK